MGFGSKVLTPDEKQKYVKEHIPYRMVAVAMALDNWPTNQAQHSLLPSWEAPSIPLGLVTNAVIEHALISSRVLLNFMGYKSNNGSPLDLKTDFRKDDDRLELLCGSNLNLTDLDDVFEQDSPKVSSVCGQIIMVADKAVAHMTHAELPPLWQVKFGLCASAIFHLLRLKVNPLLAKAPDLGGLTIADEYFGRLA